MTSRVDDFHVLSERWRLAGTLMTRTALRIGASDAGFEGVDLPVLKDRRGRPMIPGASLKGAVRSTVEALVRGAASPSLRACDPLAERGELRGCGHHERSQRAAVDLAGHCAVCRVFGSHVVASHVRFCDAHVRGSEDRVPIELRDGVAIDRDLRRVHGGQKYDFEVVSPGTVFDVEIFVENPQPWWMGLLAMGFDQMAEGFTAIGGFTSRGLGRVTFSWSSLRRETARGLLSGAPPEIFDSKAVVAQMKGWRNALAVKFQEVA